MTSRASTILIVDGDYVVTEQYDQKILWHDYADVDHDISIPNYIEQNDCTLKQKYLDWVDGFSKLDVKGRSLESFFSLDGQFSYYWPSLTSEKSYLKSPAIYQLFQLMALEEVLNQYQPNKILLVSSDKKLGAIIGQLVSNIECQFIFRRQKVVSKKNNVIHHLKKVFYSLPYFLKGIFRLIMFSWQFRTLIFSKPFQAKKEHKKQILMVSPFPGIDASKAKKGIYQSSWWGDLHHLLEKEGFYVNWVFMYFNNSQLNQVDGLRLQDDFNRVSKHERFCSVYSFFSLKIVLSVMKDYIFLYGKYWQASSTIRKYIGRSSFSLLLPEFKDSMAGSTAIMNLTYHHLFKACVTKTSDTQLACYLMENQNWEKSLVFHWKQKHKEPIIGFIHAAIRSFDFRYAGFDKKYQQAESACMPTKIAIHGHDAKVNLSTLGLPKLNVINVEALRYLYLSGIKQHCKALNAQSPLNILVLTGLDQRIVLYQCMFIARLIKAYPQYKESHFFIKPHPAFVGMDRIAKKYFHGLHYTVIDTPFGALDFNQLDCAFIENSSTVAIEALYMRLPFCLMQYPGQFNLSSLIRHRRLFVKKPSDLNHFLENLTDSKAYLEEILSKEKNLFCLDPSMHRWQRILKGEV
jgi:surface carbohydrate biosynthesis protein (TIGR04326 family)